MNIAILGATSHIARSLLYYFFQRTDFQLFLFVRNIDKLTHILEHPLFHDKQNYKIYLLNELENYEYDVVINCIGAGSPQIVRDLNWKICEITETYDNRVLSYLKNHSNTKYIYFSSGVVYKQSFLKPATKKTKIEINTKNINFSEAYRLSKINAEVKHRILNNFNIIDIRIFSYFSRFIDMSSSFFLTEIIRAIKEQKEFRTTSENIVRDYIHPEDLFQLLMLCLQKKKLNASFDAYSNKPITKFKLLKFMKDKFHLKYAIDRKTKIINATGNKKMYYSKNHFAKKLNFLPKYTSLEGIEKELNYLLGE